MSTSMVVADSIPRYDAAIPLYPDDRPEEGACWNCRYRDVCYYGDSDGTDCGGWDEAYD